MKIWTLLMAISFPGLVIRLEAANRNNNEDDANWLLWFVDSQALSEKNTLVQKQWAAFTDSTTSNREALVNQTYLKAQFDKEMLSAFNSFNASAMSKDVQRRLKKMINIGTSAETNHTKVKELAKVVNEMQFIYTNATMCSRDRTGCSHEEPILAHVMRKYSHEDKRKVMWIRWRRNTGRKMKNLYTKFVQLSNEAVQNLGYRDTGEQWRSAYESDTFVDDVQDLWNQVRPLYEQLHAYVRRRLKQFYGESYFPASGHIPAHLLGNLWAQQWDVIGELVKPFANKTTIDVTAEMIRQNYTVDTIFSKAEDFFVSLGFERMPASFWTLSMLEKPSDGRKPACQPVAFDFFNEHDFRIAMCTRIDQNNLMTAFHEMGKVVYFMQYMDQPFYYRDGANPAFHEAVGDVISLSFQTPEHLKKMGLIQEIHTDNESDINFLMNMALQKVAFLPFGYLVDQWRWSVFSGQTTPATYNADWWKLRCQLQGVSPPVASTENDFDPGAKFHVTAGIPFIRYFLSNIIQFQFHQAACIAACNLGPLHRCDIYKEVDAGDKLRDMLKLGSSKPWPEVMKQLTGQEKMSAKPLLDYFKPLYDFLRRENGNDYGWEPNCSVPT